MFSNSIMCSPHNHIIIYCRVKRVLREIVVIKAALVLQGTMERFSQVVYRYMYAGAALIVQA